MFLGNHQHRLDPKGRVILPAAFRSSFSEGLVVTVGMDRCLTVHPVETWQTVVDNLMKLETTDRAARERRIVMSGSAHPGELDSQGRVTLPQRLRDWAGLVRDVTVVGNIDHVMLWDTARWEAFQAPALEAFAATDTAHGGGA